MATEQHDLLRRYEQWPRRRGKSELLAFLRGSSITRQQSIAAKCFECSGGDGEACKVLTCPLRLYSPYSDLATD